MPSRRVFYVLALSTVLSMVGIFVPWVARAVLAFDLLLVVATLLDHHRASRIELQAERRPPTLLTQGALATVEVELRVSSRPVPGPLDVGTLDVELRDALHPALAAAPRRAALRLAGGRGLWRFEIEPRVRGEHLWGPLTARVTGPWKLARHQRTLLSETSCQIYPQVRWQGRVGKLLLLAQRRSLGRHTQNLAGVGTEPYALREYLPGDGLRKIHWKASARHDRLITREETWERGARLVILLDAARGMSGLDGDRSKLDHALAACLALARVASARGDQVTFVAFSDRIERRLRIKGGRQSIQAAYGALYDLVCRAAEPAFDLAAESAVALESRRATVVLATSVVDLAAAELLRQAMFRLQRRHRPILINLQDPELVDLAEESPTTPERAFAKTAALEIQQANRELGARLRHAGIRVVSTAADRLALETLEVYLASLGGAGGRAASVGPMRGSMRASMRAVG